MFRFTAEAVAFEVAVDVFRIETLPNVAAVSRELWGNVSERSEFVSPPDWQPPHLGTRQRRATALRRLSLLTFFGEAKKVSGCRAAPGLLPRSNDRVRYATTEMLGLHPSLPRHFPCRPLFMRFLTRYPRASPVDIAACGLDK